MDRNLPIPCLVQYSIPGTCDRPLSWVFNSTIKDLLALQMKILGSLNRPPGKSHQPSHGSTGEYPEANSSQLKINGWKMNSLLGRKAYFQTLLPGRVAVFLVLKNIAKFQIGPAKETSKKFSSENWS